jgi:hypothetical protein
MDAPQFENAVVGEGTLIERTFGSDRSGHGNGTITRRLRRIYEIASF